MGWEEYIEKIQEERERKKKIIERQHPLYCELEKILKLDEDECMTSKKISSASWSEELSAHLEKMFEVAETVSDALFVITCVLLSDPKFSKNLSKFLPAIKNYIFDSDTNISREAAEAYCYFNKPDLKEVIIKLLKSGKKYFFLFNVLGQIGNEQDIPFLMTFANDSDYEETEGMGGPWRFINRDYAFIAIEKISKERFPRENSFTSINDRSCYYYNWVPIQKWWDKHRKD